MSKNLTHLQTQLAAHDVFGQFRFITTDDGEIYFVAVDVCKILGYKNSRDALAKHVDDEDKKSVDLNTVANRDGIRDAVFDHVDDKNKKSVDLNSVTNRYAISDAVSGGWIKNEVTIINESGLYSLIFNSQLPAAKKFKRWVTSEVLPSIRKTGSYSVVKQPAHLEDNFDKFEPLLKEYFKKNPNADFDIVGASVVQGNDGLPILSLKIGLVED